MYDFCNSGSSNKAQSNTARIEADDNPILSLDALVRAIGINSDRPHAFFVGAGASISSGIPSAAMCVWEWKRRIFLTNNPGLEDQFRDVSLASVQNRIQQWLDAEGSYPPLNSAEEYGFYAEKCFPIAEDRRQYFEELAQKAEPAPGYQLLCLLAKAELVASVWTTNFDRLTAKAANLLDVTPIEVGLDTTKRIERPVRSGELTCVALHGDYRYDDLKNTPSEVQDQDQELRDKLVECLKDTSFIIVGYSGRDRSIMDTLKEAYSRSGQGRLYWCGYDDPKPPDLVSELLALARSNDREAFYIPTFGFDDLLRRLSLHCLGKELLNKAQELCSEASAESDIPLPPFRIECSSPTGIIKSNAFAVECPSEILEFEARGGFDSPGAWKRLKQQIQGRDVVAGLLKGKVLVFGTTNEIKETFKDNLVGEIIRTPISERELGFTDGVIVSVLTQALARSIAGSIDGLKTDNRRLIWVADQSSRAQVGSTVCRVHEAAILYLRRYGGKQYVVIKPTIKGMKEDGEDLLAEVEKELKRQILSKQYNDKFNDAVNEWRKRLFLGGSTSFEFPPACNSAFKSNIRAAPAFVKITQPQVKKSIKLPSSVQPHIVSSGIQFQEPYLLFSNRQGDGTARDIHPIRGIIRNQPYDFGLTRRGFGDKIHLGVVCPARDSEAVSNYLVALLRKKRPNSKREYLLEYPGFGLAFGLPLDIPEPHNNAWVECPEPQQDLDAKEGAIQLSHHITRCIQSLNSSVSPNVTLIFIPSRWQEWEHYDLQGEQFDLRDFVKAYCVQRGITTQFLRQNTLGKRYQCEIIWWLALSFYVKAMRTPWILQSLDTNTAFMGLGYSLDQEGREKDHVVLGCSHIYNSEGLGLRYKLSKIEEPVIRQGNPFMSREDARRMGDNVRQLFFESMMRLPKRVVIHKRTPFLKDEREGLLQGLSGIDSVDMLEINIDPALRYVASRLRNGQFRGDGYPVRRGTTVMLDDRKALIWVHGAIQVIQSAKPYYLGKSRIPAPLVIKRHHGTSSLSILAREILGLSKMNWNTFDMYTKLPATIQSSNEIARIGSLLERFGPMSYDYRLFI